MTMTLEPCPFCGGAPVWRPQGNDHTKSRKLTLSCPGCRIQITNAAIRHDMDWLYQITAEAWNTRTQPAQSVDIGAMTERAARAMALEDGWGKWDTARSCNDTLSGNMPEEERDHYRDLARAAITAALQEKGNGA